MKKRYLLIVLMIFYIAQMIFYINVLPNSNAHENDETWEWIGDPLYDVQNPLPDFINESYSLATEYCKGDYDATYSFTDYFSDTQGFFSSSNASLVLSMFSEFISEFQLEGDCLFYVDSNHYNHLDSLRFNCHAGDEKDLNNTFASQTSGIIDFWCYRGLGVGGSGYRIYSGNKLIVDITQASTGQWYVGVTPLSIGIATWTHISIDIECSTDSFDLYMNGTLVSESTAFENSASDFDTFNLYMADNLGNAYLVDAVGYSWEGYKQFDNFKYETITTPGVYNREGKEDFQAQSFLTNFSEGYNAGVNGWDLNDAHITTEDGENGIIFEGTGGSINFGLSNPWHDGINNDSLISTKWNVRWEDCQGGSDYIVFFANFEHCVAKIFLYRGGIKFYDGSSFIKLDEFDDISIRDYEFNMTLMLDVSSEIVHFEFQNSTTVFRAMRNIREKDGNPNYNGVFLVASITTSPTYDYSPVVNWVDHNVDSKNINRYFSYFDYEIGEWSTDLYNDLKIWTEGRHSIWITEGNHLEQTEYYIVDLQTDIDGSETWDLVEDIDFTNAYLAIGHISVFQYCERIYITGKIGLTNGDEILAPEQELFYNVGAESFFYVENGKLKFVLVADSSAVEYIYMRFTFSDCRNNSNYYLRTRSIWSNNDFGGFVRVMGSGDYYDIIFQEYLKTHRYIFEGSDSCRKQLDILIYDYIDDVDDNLDDANVSGYIEAIHFNYSEDLDFDIFVDTLTSAIIPIIILIIPTLMVSVALRQEDEPINSKAVLPMLLLMSLLCVATNQIPTWIFLVIVIATIAYFLMRNRRGEQP